MIEVTLELRLDSFLVNIVGGGGELSGKKPSKALRFTCEKIASVLQLTDNTPTAEFEFLGSSSQRETQAESGKGFDDALFKYLTTHTTVDISRVTVASDGSGYSTMPKGHNTGEIGRMILSKLPNQDRLDVELVLKSDDFEAVWDLVREQEIQQVTATLVCFQLKQASTAPHGETLFVTGIITSSLRMMPRNGC
jgi:hypothetical protein